MSKLQSVAAGLCALLVSCAGATDSTIDSARGDGFDPTQFIAASPRQVAAHTPPMVPQVSENGRLLYGAFALQQFAGRNVLASEHRAVFEPAWDVENPQTQDLALALFVFDLTGFSGPEQVVLGWEDPAPEAAAFFAGLGNFDSDHWDWFSGSQLTAGVLELADLSPYRDPNNRLLVAVVVSGTTPASLATVHIGERWIVEGVDLTELYAPVLDFETQAVEDYWATRNPVEQDYTVEVQDIDGNGFITLVISYTVDGLKLYGGARIPPYGTTDMFPVLVYCHAGSGGANIGTFGQFDLDIGSSEVKNNYVMVLPTFRGEPLQAGLMGNYVSEGTSGMYNQDADDALALLDCVLNHYHEADNERIVALGISRGAQVAQRISQRGDGFVAAIDFYGMTDYWLPEEQEYIAGQLLVAPEGTASPSYIQALYDGEYTVWDIRLGMATWSTAYYADLFPRVQIHHGTDDISVPVEQSDRLNAVLETVDGADFAYFRYDGGNHSPDTLPNCWARARSLLLSYIE